MRAIAPWLALALAFAAAPMIFSSGSALTTLSLMGVMIVFALSYNMLLGQTGLLSFGHAVYYGLGGFVAIHAMNAIMNAKLGVPAIVIPLVGGLAGLGFGFLFGLVSTKRAGIVFSMISLGLGELVSSSSFILRSFFGGEEGVTTNRAKLAHFLGFRFVSQIEVYYLIAFWCFVCVLAMYALTRTPFGRMCNAVRDNPERVEFIGYSPRMLRLIAFSFSAFFAGAAGGLAAIDFEIMNAQQLGAQQSSLVLLMAYVGGIGAFAGPIIGAIVITFLQISLSDVTSAWQLYFGLLFIGVVTWAPGGIAGLLALHRQALRQGEAWRLAPAYAMAAPALAACVVGAIMLIELGNRELALVRSEGSAMRLFGFSVEFGEPRALARRHRPARRRTRFDATALARRRNRLGNGQCAPARKSRMTAALQLVDLRKSFGATPIIRGVSLEIAAGERHAIIGPNGAGKSTLFHLVSGRIEPSSGEVRLHGERINDLRPFEIARRGLSRSFQITNIFPRLTVYENLRCATLWSLGHKYAFWKPIDRLRDARERAEWLMDSIGLGARRSLQAGVLSYAEQRALEIGVTIAGGADVIMLDEPTSGMNNSETEQAVALIRKVTEGKTLVVVEHDMSVVFKLADRISVLVYGEIIASDTPDRIRENAAVREAYLGQASH